MKSARPKVLHELCGRPMVAWVVDQALALEPERLVVVVGQGAAEVERAVRGALAAAGSKVELRCVVQEPRLGTGHALQTALPELAAERGAVAVLYGDMPVMRPESIRALVEARARAGEGALAVMTARVAEPRGFGRILRGANGSFLGIVEERDCTPEQRALREVNLGLYALPAAALREYLPRLEPANAQGELYLTDVLGMAVRDGRRVVTDELADLEEAIGVNTLWHLAEARRALQMRILERHTAAGVYVEDPATTYVDHDVEIGAGTRLLPCTVIRSGVRIGAGCEVGPFTQLRAGTVLEDGAEVGNFVECKSTRLGAHAKAKHLSYLGDGRVGARANIGAGTIFANYDGKAKHRTEVGEGAFVGSGTIVVAPGTVGAGATTGAGAVLKRGTEVPPGEVWVGVPARRIR